jgi:hypothetical protein
VLALFRACEADGFGTGNPGGVAFDQMEEGLIASAKKNAL